MDSNHLADYRVDNLETCFTDLEQSTCTANLHICYTINVTSEPTNVLIIYVASTTLQRSQAIALFRTIVKDQRLSEDEGLHACGDSYIVVSNSIHWSEKWREFLAFTDS